MHIPSPDQTVRALFSAGKHSEQIVPKSRMKDGPPMFKKEDIAESRNNLDLMLRDIFVSFDIGRSYFSDKSVAYYQNIERHSKDKAKSDTQNLIRTLEKGNITDNRFEETIRTLGFEIVDRSITLKDDVGDLHTFSISKAKTKIDGYHE